MFALLPVGTVDAVFLESTWAAFALPFIDERPEIRINLITFPLA